MLLFGDKKKLASVIIMALDGSMKEKETHTDVDLALNDASRRMISAVKSDSPENFTRALKDFLELCDAGEDEDKGPAEIGGL